MLTLITLLSRLPSIVWGLVKFGQALLLLLQVTYKIFRFIKDRTIREKTLIFIACLILAGCANPGPMKRESGKFYARNAKIKVGKIQGKGTLVIPRQPIYPIEIQGDGDMDFLLVQTCSREIAIERAGSKFEYAYIPAPGLEDNRACPLRLDGIEKGQNRRTVGWIDFEDPRMQLPATLKCNGSVSQVSGVSACEGGHGLLQRMEFTVPVKLDTHNPDCSLKAFGDQVFEFSIPRGECTHVFMERTEPYRTHRLSTYGFDETSPQRSRQ